jgi:hypothetical protein
MKNNGMFSTLFIESLQNDVHLDDAAKGRLATLAQTWRTEERQTAIQLWETFLKQAVSYLEFVPPGGSDPSGAYPLYEDWGYSTCIAVLYLVEPGTDLDETSVGRFSPAKLIAQLRRRELTWGILTDGARWRLYSVKSSRPYEDYVELDLATALESNDEAQYGLFEKFFHRDSFLAQEQESDTPGKDEDTPSEDKPASLSRSRLDLFRKQSESVLTEKVKKPFLSQIDVVLQYICNGFIYDTHKSGAEYTEEERKEIFESAVKLIYRCLFLFYAEARRLLPTDPAKAELYGRHSIAALCREAWKFQWNQRQDTDQYDLWKHLKGLVNAVNDGDPEYGIMGYNGGLFDDEQEQFLGKHQLRNDYLARALYLLAFVEPANSDPKNEYPIPYADLEVRHLGELYENILEYTVQLADADRIRRRTKKGMEIILASGTTRQPGDVLIQRGEVYFGESALERKQTGSYYTPDSLVRFLNEKTIIVPLTELFEKEYRQRFNELLEQARTGRDIGIRRGAAQSAAALVERFVQETVLKFTVCDPAMGSGHFLVDAANQMAGLIVALLEEIPSIPGMTTTATSNPNTWRRLITRHCIYGVDLNPLAVNLAKLSLWLNCFATDHPLTFIDHHLRCGNSLIGIRSLNSLKTIPERKKTKKDTNKGQLFLIDYKDMTGALTKASQDIQSIAKIDENDTDAQKAALDSAQQTLSRLHPLADLATAYLMDQDIQLWDYKELFECLAKDADGTSILKPTQQNLLNRVKYLRKDHQYFHWPLELPDVFGPDAVGGFSATIGNPPWDIVKPNSQEFFSAYDPKFRSYNKQDANKIAKKLQSDNKEIDAKWNEHCASIARQSTYFKEPQNYQALGKGDINTFKIFLEQFFSVLKSGGRMGIIIPSGLYTDQGCMQLREIFFNKSEINFLYCFENRWPAVFSAVDGRFKFVVFGANKGKKTSTFKSAFMEHDPERLHLIHDNPLKISIDQVKKFSPETMGLMEFKNQKDIEVTEKIYGDWPLLGEELKDSWNVSFSRELDMTNDSHLFKTEQSDIPLYEGKMIYHFDSNFEKPRYWLNKNEIEEALGYKSIDGSEYRLAIRSIGRNTDIRTIICSIIPPCYHGNSLPSIIPISNIWRGPNDFEIVLALSILSSFCIDFVIRKKVSANINFFYLESLPIPRNVDCHHIKSSLAIRVARLICDNMLFSKLWSKLYVQEWASQDLWYPPSAPIDTYGPAHEQEIRKRLRDEASGLTAEWGPHCGVHDRMADRRDTGDRAQLRAEIDAYVAHLYGLSRDDFAYILDTFPVLKKKEMKAFGEFMSKRKCLEEYDRIGLVLREG